MWIRKAAISISCLSAITRMPKVQPMAFPVSYSMNHYVAKFPLDNKRVDAQLASCKRLYATKIQAIHTLSHIERGRANLLFIPKKEGLDEIFFRVPKRSFDAVENSLILFSPDPPKDHLRLADSLNTCEESKRDIPAASVGSGGAENWESLIWSLELEN